MTAEQLVRALGGRRSGSAWIARFLAHEDATPSLSITAAENGKTLVCCHAGCSQTQVIETLKQRGLWASDTGLNRRPYIPRPVVEPLFRAFDSEWRTQFWWKLWHRSRPALGTVAERYLRSRAITILSPSLRFDSAALYVEGSIRLRLPALFALVQNRDGQSIGVQRIYLHQDGSDKADVPTPKKSLGRIQGGAVRLAKAGERLLLAEGIEDALSVQQATGCPAWATLGTAGLTAVELPEYVREVIICGDSDEPGIRAAKAAAHRFLQKGRDVRIAKPNGVKDFNDLLRA